MILGLITGAVWFALFLAGHIGIVRLVGKAARPRANQLIFLAGLLAIAVTMPPLIASTSGTVLTQGNMAVAIICGMLVYTSLFILYMPFYYVVAASLSVRSVVLLGRAHDGALPLSVLQEEFVSRNLVGQRLETMAENGFLTATSGGYALTAKGRLVATVFDTLKRIWKLGPGG